MSGPADRTPATHDMGGAHRFRCTPVERDEAPPDPYRVSFRVAPELRGMVADKRIG